MKNEVIINDREEEIDLVKVFSKVSKAFSRTKIYFFIFFILGIIAAVVYYNTVPKTYKSRMIISSTVFQGPSFMVILDNLTLLLEEDNYEELAKALNLDLETAKSIGKIEVFTSKNYAQDEFGEKVVFKEEKQFEMSDRKEEFVIVAYVKDNKVFKPLEEGIISYLNNNPAIKQNSLVKQQALKELKTNIYKQRIALDSLKNSLSVMLTKENASKDIYIASPGAMFTDMIGLYHAEVRATEALLASNINVVENFRLFKKQHSPRLRMTLVAFEFIFMSMYIALVIFLEGKRKKAA